MDIIFLRLRHHKIRARRDITPRPLDPCLSIRNILRKSPRGRTEKETAEKRGMLKSYMGRADYRIFLFSKIDARWLYT